MTDEPIWHALVFDPVTFWRCSACGVEPQSERAAVEHLVANQINLVQTHRPPTGLPPTRRKATR